MPPMREGGKRYVVASPGPRMKQISVAWKRPHFYLCACNCRTCHLCVRAAGALWWRPPAPCSGKAPRACCGWWGCRKHWRRQEVWSSTRQLLGIAATAAAAAAATKACRWVPVHSAMTACHMQRVQAGLVCWMAAVAVHHCSAKVCHLCALAAIPGT
jgi:hypothetical protein